MLWFRMALLSMIICLGIAIWGVVWLVQDHKYGALILSLGIINMIMIPFFIVTKQENRENN